jgi:homoserine dehydrogenase
MSIVVAGLGKLGRAVLRRAHAEGIFVAGVVDSGGFMPFPETSTSPRVIADYNNLEPVGYLDPITSPLWKGKFLVDCTSPSTTAHASFVTDAVYSRIRDLIGDDKDSSSAAHTAFVTEVVYRRGANLISVNMDPLFEPGAWLHRIAAKPNTRSVRCSPGVSGATPFVPALHRLVLGGEKVTRIRACLSQSFSTEDPSVADIAADTARKAFLLARAAGFEVTFQDVHVHDHDEAADGGIHDARYAATITPERVDLHVHDGLALGTQFSVKYANWIAVTTDKLHATVPLFVCGPDTTPESVAAGVIAEVRA